MSPIDKAWIVLHALNDLAADRASRVHHHLLDEAVGRSTNLLIHYLHCGEEGGESRVGAECVLEGAISFPPGETIAQVQKEVATAVEKSADQDEWLRTHRPKLDWLTGTWPAEVAAVHPLYRAVSDAVESVTGVEPKVYPLHAGSDIRNPILYKAVPTVGLGSLCGDLSQAGGCDEWVDLDDYIRAVKVCASIIVNWCGVETLPAETGSAGR